MVVTSLPSSNKILKITDFGIFKLKLIGKSTSTEGNIIILFNNLLNIFY